MQYFSFYWNLTQCHVLPSLIPVYLNTRQNWDTPDPPACLSIPCFPHLCLCSSSSPYSSFPNPSAPGSIPRFYFVYIWTETNKGKSNIKLAVCSRIYTQAWKCVGGVCLVSVDFGSARTHQCSTASSQKLYVICRHCSSFAVSENIKCKWMDAPKKTNPHNTNDDELSLPCKSLQIFAKYIWK